MKPVYIKPNRKVPVGPCPGCAAVLDYCTAVTSEPDGGIPAIGNLTVCSECGLLLEFAESGYARAAAQRLAEIPAPIRRAMEAAIRRKIFAAGKL